MTEERFLVLPSELTCLKNLVFAKLVLLRGATIYSISFVLHHLRYGLINCCLDLPLFVLIEVTHVISNLLNFHMADFLNVIVL